MQALLLSFILCDLFFGAVSQAATSTLVTEPSALSCDARFNLACARLNSQWLAQSLVTRFQTEYGRNTQTFFRAITNKELNYESGFYPFVFERTLSGRSVAHGRQPGFVGLTLSEIFSALALDFASPEALMERFLVMTNTTTSGNWTQYVWREDSEERIHSKSAFVIPLTANHFLGVGYRDVDAPTDLPCTDQKDGFCAIQNVQSLVGKAQYRLQEAAVSRETFEAALLDISYSEDFRLEGGFYCFVYDYLGPLVAHGVLHDYLGWNLDEILVDLKRPEDGAALHASFVATAEKLEGWYQYGWSNSRDKSEDTKIAYITKVSFQGHSYYVGSGFNFAKEEVLGCSPDYNLPCAFQSTLALSSHALAHTVSSALPAGAVWNALSTSPDFRIGEFYSFVYTFDNRCLAHGLVPDYVGLSLNDVFDVVGISLNATLLHEKFKAAAKEGGGFVEYTWLKPGVVDSEFRKVSYITHVHINGQDTYLGVGFSNVKAPTMPYLEEGTSFDGQRILCSRMYEASCSPVNVQAIVGQALADLVMASSEARVTVEGSAGKTSEDVLASITSGTALYSVNDFFVSVFSADGCGEDGLSGCVVAHGENSSYVGLGWEEILKLEGITSIQGRDLNRRLADLANSGGESVDIPWSRELDVSQTKQFWASRFRNNRQSFYVVADYTATPLPPTCDACPSGLHCTTLHQDFCDNIPPPPYPWFYWLLGVIIALTAGLAMWYSKYVSKRRIEAKIALMERRHAEEMERQLIGMVKVEHDMPPLSAFDDRVLKQAVWYWEEDANLVSKHKHDMVRSGTNFVRYSNQVSGTIEHSYQLFMEGKGLTTLRLDLTNRITSTPNGGKVNNPNTGMKYDVNFEKSEQVNAKTKHPRRLLRDEEVPVQDFLEFELPPIPNDLQLTEEQAGEGEVLLPASKGQMIQVTKQHSDGDFLFGTVCYDPVLIAAQSASVANEDIEVALSKQLHYRKSSGWFPKCIVENASVEDMGMLMKVVGGNGMESLKPPSDWSLKSNGDYEEGLVVVSPDSNEYKTVTSFFMNALYKERGNFKVVQLERIQSLQLFQSYAVKRQTVVTRDQAHPEHREHNLDAGEVERAWLFHGTTEEAVPKIAVHGLNRTYAGRNGIRFGAGCYHARDSSYAYSFSRPNRKGVYQMFMCRVVVGDWCLGTTKHLTPDSKKHNKLELFDTTVDNVDNPSIFVTYHDAASFPEYLVSFKKIDAFLTF